MPTFHSSDYTDIYIVLILRSAVRSASRASYQSIRHYTNQVFVSLYNLIFYSGIHGACKRRYQELSLYFARRRPGVLWNLTIKDTAIGRCISITLQFPSWFTPVVHFLKKHFSQFPEMILHSRSRPEVLWYFSWHIAGEILPVWKSGLSAYRSNLRVRSST